MIVVLEMGGDEVGACKSDVGDKLVYEVVEVHDCWWGMICAKENKRGLRFLVSELEGPWPSG